jgi:uncharacterized protein with PIN domain
MALNLRTGYYIHKYLRNDAVFLFAEARIVPAGAKAFSRIMAAAGIEVVAFDSGQAEIALDAWRRYGRGRHTASLNLGDCAPMLEPKSPMASFCSRAGILCGWI